MSDRKSVLIISYVFPPYPGIGGRRWAKFAKYLCREGHRVHVLCAENPLYQESPWKKDTEAYAGKITRLPPAYPSPLLGIPCTLSEKILYRISLFYVRMFGKGNYYDRSLFWGKRMLGTAASIIEKEKINNVVVTGGPFRYMYNLIALKKQFPHVNFIADFRDPWTTNRTAFGFEKLSPSRKQFELHAEKEVILNYDYITAVADEMTHYFMTLCPENSRGKCLTVRNGFDREDFPGKIPVKQETGKHLRFLFAGTLYDKSEYIFRAFTETLDRLRQMDPAVYRDMQFEFYGTFPSRLKEMVKERKLENIKISESIPLAEVYGKIAGASVCMLFLTMDLNYSFSTKFYEYLSQGKKIAVFSEKGKTGDYVVNNGLGYALTPGNMFEEMNRIHRDFMEGRMEINPHFDIRPFDVSDISRKIAELLR